MKKLFLLAFIILTAFLTSCNGSNNNSSETPEIRVVSGSATLVWHYDETFMAIVDVTLNGDTITNVTVRDSSYVHTGDSTFRLWTENKDYYLESYIGLTVDEIKALKADDPIDVTNHNDGGSMSGAVDAIAGATASSTVVAKAIKAAILNAIS